MILSNNIMNDEQLAQAFSTIVLPHLTPEAFGKLMQANKTFKQLFERHAFWKEAVMRYFPKTFRKHNNTPDANWLKVFQWHYKHAFQWSSRYTRELFADVNLFNNSAMLHADALNLTDLLYKINCNGKLLISTIIHGKHHQALRDYVFNEIQRHPQMADEYGFHWLHWAVVLNQRNALSDMLAENNNVDINIATQRSTADSYCYLVTPLHLAVRYNRLRIAAQLLAAGADVSAHNTEGYSPLHLAVKYNRFKIMRLFIKANANLTAKTTGYRKDRPVDLAAQYGAIDVMKMLIKAQVSVNRKRNAEAPLWWAMYLRNLEMLRVLIRGNVDVNQCFLVSKPPLFYAIDYQNVEMVRALIQAGAKLRTINFSNEWFDKETISALDYAYKFGEDDIVKVIIEAMLSRYINKRSNNITPHQTSCGLFSKTARKSSKMNAAHNLIELVNGTIPDLPKQDKTTLKHSPTLESLYNTFKSL